MAFSVTTQNTEKTYNKEIINIGSSSNCDITLNLGFDFLLTVQYNPSVNKCIILNRTNSDKFLFKGKNLPQQLIMDKVCKLMIKDSDEFITIKFIQDNISKNSIQFQNFSNLSEEKEKIENQRIKIVNEIGGKIAELKRNISINSKFTVILQIVLLIASMICAFGISNYLSGITMDTSTEIIQMPMNVKLLFMYALIVYSTGLMLKHGFFIYLWNKTSKEKKSPVIAEKLMIVLPLIFFVSIYLINVTYYLSSKCMPVYSILISLFFTGTVICLSVGCGYVKYCEVISKKDLEKFEYRQDFEEIMRLYSGWIEKFINNLSDKSLEKVKDKIFKLQIISLFEVILGIITSPFLAYGVSNTLAMCFPEAAGWIRIGGLRFSPIFLVLATFLIIFAFFSFVSAFTIKKKINASEVIKQDGFNNFYHHGTDIYGLEGVKRLEDERRMFFLIGLAIIFIEFSMNVSYFVGEIGGNITGMFLSGVAALVPTALLLAETVMLSHSNFELNALNDLISKIDR